MMNKMQISSLMLLMFSSLAFSGVNPLNISKTNIQVKNEIKNECKTRHKIDFNNFAEMDCTSKGLAQASDDGRLEGTKEFAIKNYTKLSSDKMFAKLVERYEISKTARRYQDVDRFIDHVDGELYQRDYTHEINYLVLELVKRKYAPKWSDATTHDLEMYWNAYLNHYRDTGGLLG